MVGRRFEGRTALVTGAARGIGAAICRALGAEGAQVAVNYQTRKDAAERLVQDIEAAGGRAMAIAADVSDAAQVTALVRTVEQELGPVDLLVNNAAVFQLQTHETLTLAQWQRTLAVNLTGTFLVTWAVKDGMLARRFGRIVNVSSIAALRARARCIDYAVTKAGLVSFTKSCAESFAPYNVRVNALAPGLIETEMIADISGELRQKLIDDTPMGRIGRPEEMASVVCFLLSEDSSFMTGQTLVACGGRVPTP
ncbi:MAG: glucose 1-dehydrogenase [Planctomycetes bacterium]|nr:glucose 1-dehydrogenase [Planctomycetota bacterium]